MDKEVDKEGARVGDVPATFELALMLAWPCTVVCGH